MAVVSSKCAAALSTWKRLSNTPHDLSESTAVQWLGFIAVIDVRGNCLLFHVKWNVWSQLPKLPGNLAKGCPLACFDDKLLALAQNGILYEFIPRISQWKTNQTLDLGKLCGQVGVQTQQPAYVEFASCGNTLFVIYMHQTQQTGSVNQQRGLQRSQPATNLETFLKMYDGSSWSHPSPLNLDQNVPRLSITTHSPSTIYINTDHAVYSIQVSPQSASSTSKDIDLELKVTTHSPPPLERSTLCMVDDSLFAFGGKDEDSQPFANVYQYIQETDSWQVVGCMGSSRYGVAIAVFKGEEESDNVFVVGGCLGGSTQATNGCRIIESCKISVKREI